MVAAATLERHQPKPKGKRMAYRIFKRTWWRDKACTKPGAGRKRYSGQTAETMDEARRICADNNREDFGSPDGRGDYGMAWEFES
jgi:hypothetical protein